MSNTKTLKTIKQMNVFNYRDFSTEKICLNSCCHVIFIFIHFPYLFQNVKSCSATNIYILFCFRDKRSSPKVNFSCVYIRRSFSQIQVFHGHLNCCNTVLCSQSTLSPIQHCLPLVENGDKYTDPCEAFQDPGQRPCQTASSACTS